MQLTISSPKIWIAQEAVDFRKSIDGLCEIVSSQFSTRVQEGVYVFFNRSRNKLKILAWHGNGFVLLYKRLEQGKFTISSSDEDQIALDEKQISWLLAGLDWVQMSAWNTLEYDDFT